jgi:hypothetical protein
MLRFNDMELWTLINKETGDIIRFNKVETDDSEFGDYYYFSEFNLYPPWFATKSESIEFLLKSKKIHPLYSQSSETPDFINIDLSKYKIKHIIL